MEQQEKQKSKLKDLFLKQGAEFLAEQKLPVKEAEFAFIGYCSGFVDGYNAAKNESLTESDDKLSFL